MLEDAKNTLETLQENLASKAKSLDLEARREHLLQLEEESNAPDLWENPTTAQVLMQKLAAAREVVAPFNDLEKRTAELAELIELAQIENDADLAQEIERDLKTLEIEYSKLETATLFGGEYDANNAIFLSTPERAEPKRRIGRRCSCAPTFAGRKTTNSASKSWKKAPETKPESRVSR